MRWRMFEGESKSESGDVYEFAADTNGRDDGAHACGRGEGRWEIVHLAEQTAQLSSCSPRLGVSERPSLKLSARGILAWGSGL